jgi:Na+-transporting NADH:ubiquinone oxidoreductase subunit C
MKSYSNTYIFIFATVLVIVVATLLTFVSESLRPYQEKNVEVEKKLDILRSVGLSGGVAEAKNKNQFVEEKYADNITKSFVINIKGEVQDGLEAFPINLKEELRKDSVKRDLPVFIYTDPEGEEITIVPLQGKGLWGPIWGYMSFKPDMSTVYGCTFSHAKETPGLGAEIAQDFFQEQFKGKTIFDKSGKFTSIQVLKGGAGKGNPHGVDAVSGGTITSKGLQAMLLDCLGNYENYFNLKKNSHE